MVGTGIFEMKGICSENMAYENVIFEDGMLLTFYFRFLSIMKKSGLTNSILIFLFTIKLKKIISLLGAIKKQYNAWLESLASYYSVRKGYKKSGQSPVPVLHLISPYFWSSSSRLGQGINLTLKSICTIASIAIDNF